MAFWPMSKGTGELFPIPRRCFASEIRLGGGGEVTSKQDYPLRNRLGPVGWRGGGSLERSGGREVFGSRGDDDDNFDKRLPEVHG
jgi:hypothetical protein